MAKIQLTTEDYKRLEEELKQLKTVGRKEAAEKIQVARSYGDLSENSEYEEAMNDQAKLESRIGEIEYQLKNAEIISVDALGTENVHIGSTVTVQDKKKTESTYTIVTFSQVDPAEGKISDESPVGKALIGHKKGDKVLVDLPSGQQLQLKITAISK